MKKIYRFLIVAIILISLTGCTTNNKETQKISKTDFYFDTVITITLYDTSDATAIDECFALADRFENMLSNTIPESEISIINERAGTGEYTTVSPETLELLQKGIYFSELSDGKFDITCGKVSKLWNISEVLENLDNNEHMADSSVLPSKSALDAAVSHVNYQMIDIKDNQVLLTDSECEIDLGGIAKGYIADCMKAQLNEKGYHTGVINLGGNILTLGSKGNEATYKIGILEPFNKNGDVLGAVDFIDGSVVTSGIYERYYKVDDEIYHHIIDLSTGYPCKNDLYQVTIVSDLSVDGDALSTICLLAGLDNGMEIIEKVPNTEAIFVTADNQIHTTSGFGTALKFESN